MAKTTIEKFKVSVTFTSEREKFAHLIRSSYDILSPTQNSSFLVSDHKHTNLSDEFKFSRVYTNPKDKWDNYFRKGEWVKSYDVIQLSSNAVSDEFEVEVTYAGKQKNFDKSFHSQWISCKIAEYKEEILEVNTVTVTPKGSKKEYALDLKIIKNFIDVAAISAGLKRSSKISEENGFFKTSIVSGSHYHNFNGSSVCLHLGKWKIGFCPKEGDMSKIRIAAYVLRDKSEGEIKKISPWDYKDVLDYANQPAFKSINLINDNKRTQLFEDRKKTNEEAKLFNSKLDMNKTEDRKKKMRTQSIKYVNVHHELGYVDHFLGDPTFDTKLIAFIKEVYNRPTPTREQMNM